MRASDRQHSEPRRVLLRTEHRGVVYPVAGWRVSNPRSDRPAAAEGRGFNSSGRGLAEQPAPIGPCRCPPPALFSFVSLVRLTGRVCQSDGQLSVSQTDSCLSVSSAWRPPRPARFMRGLLPLLPGSTPHPPAQCSDSKYVKSII